MKWEEYKKGIKSIPEEEIMYIDLVADIVSLREEKGITQAQLAEMTGLKQEAIARFENPSDGSNTLTVLKVLNALNYDLAIKPKSN